MNILSKEEFETEIELFEINIKEGVLFIHPTDTIYGIGCNATLHDSVYKVREVKDRHTVPFSIIAPSKEWIKQNCEVDEKVEEWLEKLPGPYTLILKLRNKDAVAPNVNMDLDTIGVRIPDHWFSKIVERLGFPTITTSANLTGENFMTSIEDLNPQLKSKIEFVIYEGEKKGKPSKIIDLTKDEINIKER